jgi:hypothetical protein
MRVLRIRFRIPNTASGCSATWIFHHSILLRCKILYCTFNTLSCLSVLSRQQKNWNLKFFILDEMDCKKPSHCPCRNVGYLAWTTGVLCQKQPGPRVNYHPFSNLLALPGRRAWTHHHPLRCQRLWRRSLVSPQCQGGVMSALGREGRSNRAAQELATGRRRGMVHW